MLNGRTMRSRIPPDLGKYTKFGNYCFISRVNDIFPDKWGIAETLFGKIRRVSTKFGYGVWTCPHFLCKKGDAVFVLRDMLSLNVADANLLEHWDGYIFDSHEHGKLIPPFSKDECKFDPPMMVNTACESDDESNNLLLLDHRNHIVFEANRDIGGGESLLVDYGPEYNGSLGAVRLKQRLARENAIKRRRNAHHDFECPYCGLTMLSRFRIGHTRYCQERDKREPSDGQGLE